MVTLNADTSVVATYRPNANLMFVTATQLVMPFGNSAATSQTNADAFCNARATAASLPGTYVAWLSTSTRSAMSKLGTANGWVRTDGRPFANTKADLAAGKIFYPPLYSESGADTLSAFYSAATGTAADGTATANTCADWTSTSGATAGGGEPSRGTKYWTDFFARTCNAAYVLYCFETAFNTVVKPPPVSGRYAFVSKGTVQPAAGHSRATFDALCQSEATTAALPGTYLALVATTQSTAIARFTTSAGSLPWFRPDGVQLVTAAAGLLGDRPELLAAFDVMADGTYVVDSWPWTGALQTDQVGTLATTCNDWSSTVGSGDGGTTAGAYDWYNEFQESLTCVGSQPVFCLQQ
ncbi:MAG: hypothetical protein ACJ8F1_21730 [Polyangia bacterium]|jgi:hypothetical protein